jgi:DUF4097 and DUF4098 domain-containing protein YvlB
MSTVRDRKQLWGCHTEASGPASDYALDLDTSYGKVKVDGDNYDEHLKRNEDGSKSIKANLSSGDVTVDFK